MAGLRALGTQRIRTQSFVCRQVARLMAPPEPKPTASSTARQSPRRNSSRCSADSAVGEGSLGGQPEYGGLCPRCGEVHSIPRTPAAEEEARRLVAELHRVGSFNLSGQPHQPGDPLATAGLVCPGPGRMLGVLVCERTLQNSRPQPVILRAFSGQVGTPLVWEVSGWSGPIQTMTWTHPVYREYRRVIDGISVRINHLTAAVDPSVVPRDKLSSGSDGKQGPQDELIDKIKMLKGRRKACSHELLCTIQKSYRLQSIRGDTRPLADVWRDTRQQTSEQQMSPQGAKTDKSGPGLFPAGTGDCSGPKLLAEAARRGLRPLGMAEVWFGAPSVIPSVTPKHQRMLARMARQDPKERPAVMTKLKLQRLEGQVYPCCDKCRRIMGWQLCGMT